MTADASADVERLWTAYKESAARDVRDQLILHYSPLVKYVAGRVAVGLPQNVEQADLVSYGIFGLIDAIDKFDPSRGFKFETYAIARIKGAILDELRSIDWVPRSVRKKARDLAAATERCQERLNRGPTATELSDELGLTKDALHSMRAQVGQTRVTALDEMLSAGDGDEGVSLAETLADPFAEQPGDALEEADLHDALSGMLAELPERLRAVLVHSYVDGLTLAQIGQILGVTESRVCQLRSKALKLARAGLEARLAV